MSADDGRDDRSTDAGDETPDGGLDGEFDGEINGDLDGKLDGGSAATRDGPRVSAPDLPIRKPLPVRVAANPALLGPTAEELAADQPSVETLRRVRHALRALPEPD